ncbi:hypothetical protein [Lentzea albida]|uniref:Uncharacterized protein n=1 Tax=Lentzea albida TaxID=65499 RepID=A0A1H9UAQ0_9PSEU|nr:hypothetical protein [Lentzea albida]SES06526.1 hypothetical protein SAMN04488000_115144 [Lentzea albida]
MSYAVDNVLDEIAIGMKVLRDTTKGIPDVGGIRASHERARKAVGALVVALEDVRSKISDS